MRNVKDISNQNALTSPTVTYGDNYLQRLESLLIRNKRGLKRAFNYIQRLHGYHPFEYHGLVDNSKEKLPPCYPCIVDFYQHFEGSMSEMVYCAISMETANEMEKNGIRNFLLEYDDNATLCIYSLAVSANGLKTLIVKYKNDVYCAKEIRPYKFQMTCIDSEALNYILPFGKFKTKTDNVDGCIVRDPVIRITTPCEEYYRIRCNGSAA